tara:strand:- start:57104 stop:57862 length:759 start_codon:yes stop_codon:yes gene_type:complete
MKAKIILVWIFIMVGFGIYLNFSKDKDHALSGSFNNYRHKISKAEIKAQKKYILSQQSKEKVDSKKREVAQVDSNNQVIDVANPLEKREELKKELSMRGRDNRVRNSREPDTKIVYGDGNGNQYRLLNDFVAVKKTKENENDYPDAKIKLGHFIVPAELAPSDAIPLMENAQTGNIAIFTGLIKVKLTDMRQAESLISQVRYDIHLRYEHIGLVMYKFSSYEDTMLAKRELDQSSYVRRATIELLEYERQPQ